MSFSCHSRGFADVVVPLLYFFIGTYSWTLILLAFLLEIVLPHILTEAVLDVFGYSIVIRPHGLLEALLLGKRHLGVGVGLEPWVVAPMDLNFIDRVSVEVHVNLLIPVGRGHLMQLVGTVLHVGVTVIGLLAGFEATVLHLPPLVLVVSIRAG
uniref:Uncharacterized protein n=1 Tax=Strombidium inclinatum TaxID=197538 RepID=A0A7S3IKN7_9SPIT